MQIVRAELSDIDAIMACIADAQRFLARLGVDQWQDGYPTKEIIEQDILRGESFVMTEDGKVIATAVISFTGEPTYSVIEGSWSADIPYGVIHRLAVRDSGRGGVARRFFSYAEAMAEANGYGCIRVDTHSDNRVMLHLLEELGYARCGVITLTSGAKRVAFEKIWQTTKI